MKETISYKSSGNTGDLIYSLSVMSQQYFNSGRKADIYLHLNQPSTFTDATHPVGNVMLNQTMFDMVKPLLIEQEYVNSVEVYHNQEIDYNLDLFRLECKNLSAGDIKLWHTIPYPELRTHTHAQVLWACPADWKYKYVVINRSSRYNNPLIDYTQIAELGMKMYFVGVEREYEVMKAICPEVEYYPVNDFDEMAQLIAGCEYFFGNQSMAFAIAEQMKVKRVLEQYYNAPNVIPNGGEWYAYQTNEQLNRIILTIKEKCRKK
jgi:hypothetical protein